MKLFSLSLLAAVAVSTSLLSHSQAVSLQNRTHALSSRFYLSPFSQTGMAPASLQNAPGAQDALDKVLPSVVSIYGYKDLPSDSISVNRIEVPLFHFLLAVPTAARQQVDAGTGFFVSDDGYLLTSNHVVSDASAYYVAMLSDGTEKNIAVIYRDLVNDIAVLKIDGSGYPALRLGDSAGLRKGQALLATGNAFGQNTAITSSGNVTRLHENIISADGNSERLISDLFETDMQLYPGDSGGPTFDTSGTVLGINDAIALDETNVSFSIPINYAKLDLQIALSKTNAGQ